MEITTRNVCTAFKGLVTFFNDPENLSNGKIVATQSRNGGVRKLTEPLLLTYTHPRERCLVNPARDVNPFSLLYESLWMLAGRNDVAPMVYYTKKFGEYSDDGKILNGAYGNRWRHNIVRTTSWNVDRTEFKTHWKIVDQLRLLINHLKSTSNSRRGILTMWNIEDDLLKVGCGINGNESMDYFHHDPEDCYSCRTNGLRPFSKDVCCNLSVMFSLRETFTEGWGGAIDTPEIHKFLDMTVTNRSNDMIWGLLNANYVTFSILQEYMAANIGVEVGVYRHFTNDCHVYDWNWKPDEWIAAEGSGGWRYGDRLLTNNGITWKAQPLIKDPAQFDKEVIDFVEMNWGDKERPTPDRWQEPFLRETAQPIMTGFQRYKQRSAETMMWTKFIRSEDWRAVCQNWLERRLMKEPKDGNASKS